jgi:hypothetical protein
MKAAAFVVARVVMVLMMLSLIYAAVEIVLIHKKASEQKAVKQYDSTVTAPTVMVKLERDTFGYTEFSCPFCSLTRSSLAAHLAMVSKASIHWTGVIDNDHV